MKFSSIWAVTTLALSTSVFASGIPPVTMHLLFKPFAERSLKANGIDDVRRIVSAGTPFEATFCRTDSDDLWRVVLFTPEQLQAASLAEATSRWPRRETERLIGSMQPPEALADPNGICKRTLFEKVEPYVVPGTAKILAVGLIALLKLVGLYYSYRAFMHSYYRRHRFADKRLQDVADSMPREYAGLKAIGAFVAAGVVAYLSFGLPL